MFGSLRKKHRQPAQPLTAATANPNAATAAAAVFGRRDSNGSLSSSAAAAALRARPTTPTNVAEVQTKRTLRRSASVSSQGSHRERTLHRSPSQGSMTERTFRSPSPSPQRSPIPAADDAPPVPSIPQNIQTGDLAPTGTHKRSTSLHTQPFRVASQKKQDGGGSWFGAASQGDASLVRKSDAPLNTQPAEPSRAGAVSPSSSINFSYPRGLNASSPPPSSPPPQKAPSIRSTQQQQSSPRRSASVTSHQSSISSDQSLVYDPNSRRMVPKAELLAQDQAVREISEKPVRKRRQQQQQQQQQAGLGRSGSHLARGSVSRVKGTAVEPDGQAPTMATTAAATKTTSPPPPKAKTPPPPVQAAPQEMLSRPEASEQSKTQSPTPQAAMVPSTAFPASSSSQPAAPEQELESEPESDLESELEPAPEPVVTGSPSPRLDSTAAVMPQHIETKPRAPVLGRKPSIVQEESDEDELQPSREGNSVDVQPDSTTHQATPAALKQQHGSVRSARQHSNSPVRNARFSLNSEQLFVKHEPPPRSVSPRKSALKHSPSPARGASPSDDSSELGSDMNPSLRQDDHLMPRKKAVRVSFDDENTKVIGESAQEQQPDSPVVPSPQQSRRPWFSNIGRNKKKDLVTLDDDEIMKPRPALPSFGSIREKKPREPEERPLVRPSEPAHSSTSTTPTVLPSSPDDEEIQDPIGQSNDQNIGSLLNQEHTSRNVANISKFREPLPPVVTSLEGSGYYSPSSTSSSEDEDEAENGFANDELPTQPSTASEATWGTTKDDAQEPTATAGPVQLGLPEVQDEGPAQESLDDYQSAVTAAKAAVGPTNGSLHMPPKALDDAKQEEHDQTIPSISIIEPSPKIREPEGRKEEADYFDLPGGFPEESSEENAAPPQTPPPKVQKQVQPQGETADTPQPSRGVPINRSAEKIRIQTQPKPNRRPPPRVVDDDSDSSSSGIYSDAYEDLSELDDGGFMSLDAVLTTPVSEQASKRLFEQAMAGSPMIGREERLQTAKTLAEASRTRTSPEPEIQPEDDWEKAKLYWKSLTTEKRKQLEQEARDEAGVEADQEEVVTQPKKPKKKRSSRVAVEPLPELLQQEAQHADPNRVYQIKPGTKVRDDHEQVEDDAGRTMRRSLRGNANPPMNREAGGSGRLRKSMRGGEVASTTVAAPEPRFRKSLRSGAANDTGFVARQGQEEAAAAGGGKMRRSMRQENGATVPVTDSGAGRGSGRGSRPMSLPQAPATQGRPMKHKKQTSLDIAQSSAAAAAITQPTLRRRASDSSESSFKRARPQRQGLGFRTSMRPTSPEQVSPGRNKSSRFSLRSLSPPASPPPTSMSNRMTLRSTLRSDSSDGSTHRMRVPSFGRSSGKKAAAKKKKNRFQDSSDEDDAGQFAFNSRFGDSSDEDAPTPVPIAPTGGLASKSMRNRGADTAAAAAPAVTVNNGQDEVSEELPDSSDEEHAPPQRTASGRLLAVNPEGHGLQRKRSGRGELAAASTSAGAAGAQGSARPGHRRRGNFFSVLRRKKDGEVGKISRPEPMESAARQGTRLERSDEQVTALRKNSGSLRLQKQRAGGWPFADEAETVEDKRPATSGGVTTTTVSSPTGRPSTKRRSTSHGILGLVGHHHHHNHDQDQDQPREEVATPDVEEQSQADGSVRKKKFGKLRKMFGLND